MLTMARRSCNAHPALVHYGCGRRTISPIPFGSTFIGDATGDAVEADGAYILIELRGGFRFWINPRDRFVSQGMLGGVWELDETTFARRFLKPGMHALDIGANLGWYAVHFARWVGEHGLVTAFEPRADLHRQLCRTLAANDLSNVIAHPVALGAAETTLLLRWPRADENPGGAQLCVARTGVKDPDYVYQETPVRPLDAIVDRRVDFIKIDIEGAEKLVFDGARRILSVDRPVILAELAPAMLRDVSGVTIDDYFAYLRGKAYRVFELAQQGELYRELTDWPFGPGRDLVNVVLLPAELPLPD